MRKEKHAGVRVGAQAYAVLQRRAEALGLTFSQYARKMLFAEMPHVATFDVADKILDAAHQEHDPAARVVLLTQALRVVEEGEAALLASKPFLDELLGPRYKTSLQEYATAKADLHERIAVLSGTLEMLTTMRKLGGMER